METIDLDNYPWSPFAQTIIDLSRKDPEFAEWVRNLLQEHFDEVQT